MGLIMKEEMMVAPEVQPHSDLIYLLMEEKVELDIGLVMEELEGEHGDMMMDKQAMDFNLVEEVLLLMEIHILEREVMEECGVVVGEVINTEEMAVHMEVGVAHVVLVQEVEMAVRMEVAEGEVEKEVDMVEMAVVNLMDIVQKMVPIQ